MAQAKWKNAPHTGKCIHQNAQPLNKSGEQVSFSRLGFTTMWCYLCGDYWWEPNSNLRKLGIIG